MSQMVTMETSKEIWLTNFPSDVWECIALFLAGEHLGQLKMTGSKALWNLLCYPYVVKAISLGNEFIQFKSWPAFLKEFPCVEELSIYQRSEGWWSKLGVKLSLLPSTLRKLEITGNYPNLSDFFADGNGGTTYLDEQLPLLEFLNFSSALVPDHRLLARIPPTLTSLQVNTWSDTIAYPPSVTYLKVWNIQSSSGNLNLPPELRKLEAVSLPLLDFTQLVPPLTSLKIDSLSDSSLLWSPEKLSSLPATLTELDIITYASMKRLILPVSSWPYLPRTLKKFSFETSLRNQNTGSKMVIDSNGVSHSIPTYTLEHLPRSITHLQIDLWMEELVFFDTLTETSTFPPQMTTFIAPNISLSINATKQLPASLTWLITGNLSKHVSEHLPRSLNRLQAGPTSMSADLIKSLPKTLLSLQLGGKQSSFLSDTKKPLAYTDLDEHHSNWSCLPFPPNLTSLALLSVFELGDSFFQNQRFLNLHTLATPQASDITDITIPLLNRHLTSLDLSSSSRITGKCFSLLPKSLTKLILSASSLIDDSDIRHLPTTLQHIHLDNAMQLTDACVSDFPRYLLSLRLRKNTIITKTCFSDLPYLLKSLPNSFETATMRITAGGLVSKMYC